MTLVCLSLCGLIGALWIATGSGAFSGWKSAREQEVAERPLGSAIAVQRELASGVSR
jgi:hypothetical protein